MQISELKKLDQYTYEIPKTGQMRVPGRVFSSQPLLDEIKGDKSLEQLINVATIPGIYKYAIAMPDMHQGYGFPVGGVAATLHPAGLISPGGIGYDINCGVRLLRSKLTAGEIQPVLKDLAHQLQRDVPSGVGRGGEVKLSPKEMDELLNQGAPWIVQKKGFGREEDLEQIESGGYLGEADAAKVSDKAKRRGLDQVGTLGAGNHFLEIQQVENILLPKAAKAMGLKQDQVVLMIHCGSRGLGHQIATDYIEKMLKVMPKYDIELPDKELAGSPLEAPEGRDYFAAMSAAANFAWANRQVITHLVRNSFREALPKNLSAELDLVYDVSHNIAKIEKHDGKKLIVHRKGATRAFEDQPVLIPGSMGTASYVLVGTKESSQISFGSTCHGAGRRLSRTAAKKQVWGKDLKKELEERGIAIAAGSMPGLAEEAPLAYKDVDEVIKVVDTLNIARAVARLTPLGVIKG